MGSLAPGTRIGDYVIDGPLGQGGMGAVYRARRALDGGVVAVKTLSAGSTATEEQRKRFEREALLAARLSHPHIVKVHASGVQGFTSWIAMDLIEGRPLSDLVGRVTPAEAARLVAQVARAVAHAHAHGVVHRDLKPANVLVHDGRAFVTDFGIARPVEDSTRLTRTGALVGTPTYLSPEQATGGEVGPPSDVHALGVLLHELLTGAPPFVAGDIVTLLAEIAESRPRPPSAIVPGVPRALDDAVRAALDKDPARRPSASGFAALLEAPMTARGGRAKLAALALAFAPAVVGLGVIAAARSREAPATRTTLDAPPARAPVRPAAREASRPEPPFTPPPWLRGLETRGDRAAVSAAYAAAARPEEVDERSRARAIAALERLDGAWKEPEVLAADRSDRLADLVRIHATWLRLDPAHRMSPGRAAAVADSWAWVITLRATPEDVHETVLDLMRLTPDDVGVYGAYAQISHGLPRDPEVLRRGRRLAVARGDAPLEGIVGRELANDLLESVQGHERPIPGATEELLALARDFARRPDPLAPDMAKVLLLAAHLPTIAPAEGRAFAAKAEAACGPSRLARQARYELELNVLHRGRDAAQGERVIGAAEDLLAATKGDEDHEDIARDLSRQVAALHREAGRPDEALASRRRFLAVMGPTGLPDVALRLVVELASAKADDAALAAALVDLERRLVARALVLRGRGAIAEAALVEATRAEVDPAAPRASAGRLEPWLASAELLAALADPRP